MLSREIRKQGKIIEGEEERKATVTQHSSTALAATTATRRTSESISEMETQSDTHRTRSDEAASSSNHCLKHDESPVVTTQNGVATVAPSAEGSDAVEEVPAKKRRLQQLISQCGQISRSPSTYEAYKHDEQTDLLKSQENLGNIRNSRLESELQ